VPASAVLLVLAAAILHAGWNLHVAGRDDTAAATATAFLAGTVLLLPIAVATWDVSAAAIPFMVVSAALELVYLALLAAAYRRSELTVVYPVARGSAPVLVLLAAAIVGGGASGLQAVGVIVVSAGIVLVRGLGAGARSADVLAGLAIGVVIAGYTVVDDHGLDHAAALPYLLVVVGVPAVVYAAAVLPRRGRAAVRRELTARALLAGVAMVGAYGLTLLALERAPAPPVAALRETSILIAVAWAALGMREPVGVRRAAGALLVVAGVALVTLG
jgi:drug/metabolite transporter (DMT)-like permease